MGNSTSSGLGKTLVEYTGVMTPVTYEHTKAHKGLYVITAQAIDDESQVTFFLSLVQKPPKNLKFRPNAIKIKTGGQKISLRWNLRYARLLIIVHFKHPNLMSVLSFIAMKTFTWWSTVLLLACQRSIWHCVKPKTAWKINRHGIRR